MSKASRSVSCCSVVLILLNDVDVCCCFWGSQHCCTCLVSVSVMSSSIRRTASLSYRDKRLNIWHANTLFHTGISVQCIRVVILAFFTRSFSQMTWREEFRHWLMSAELPLRSANIPASLAPDVSPAWFMELILISFQ